MNENTPRTKGKGPAEAGPFKNRVVTRYPTLVGGADHFDFDTTVRLQAVDQCAASADVVARGAGHRLALALAFGVDTLSVETTGHEVVLHGCGTTLRQALVVAVGADAVGVAGCKDDFEVDLIGFGGQFVKLLTAFRTQDGFVEVEQGVGGQLDLLSGR